MTSYLIIFAIALISGLTTLIGVALAIKIGRNYKLVSAGIGFSVGIMILISFFELIPQTIQSVSIIASILTVLIGAGVLALLNYLIPHIHIVNEATAKENVLLKTAYLVALGLIIHDFPEGFAMANSYIISPTFGVLIATSIALHNIPEEFAMAVPLVCIKRKSTLYKMAFWSGLAEPAGAVIGILAVSIMPILTPYFLAFAAGAMIYISIHELIPLAKMYKNPAMFIAGALVSVLVYVVLHFSIQA